MKTKVRLKYNAPFVLTFSIACVLVQLLQLIPGLSELSDLFTVSRHTVFPGGFCGAVFGGIVSGRRNH